MRVFHEPVNTDLTDMELIELKFIFARRETIRCTFHTAFFEVLSQCTTTTVTMRSSPIINLDMGHHSMNKQLFLGKNLECVFIARHKTIY